MKYVAIIDCGSGNLHSIRKAFEQAASRSQLTAELIITQEAETLKQATHIVLPGVGAFSNCMRGLHHLPEMSPSLEREVLHHKKPFLGVCVGMQMLAEESLEHGHHKGLGWIKGKVVPIADDNQTIKIPHMGWNNLAIRKKHPIMDNIADNSDVYFVHSYHMECTSPEPILATCEYGTNTITAALVQQNIIATQFHPEKSQHVGLQVISNFLKMS